MEAIRIAICKIARCNIPPAPAPPPIPVTHIYWCVGSVCASANIIDSPRLNTLTVVKLEYIQLLQTEILTVFSLIIILLAFLAVLAVSNSFRIHQLSGRRAGKNLLNMILLGLRKRIADAASSCVSTCMSDCTLIYASAVSNFIQSHLRSAYQAIKDSLRRHYQSIRGLPYNNPSALESREDKEIHRNGDELEVPSRQSPTKSAGSFEARLIMAKAAAFVSSNLAGNGIPQVSSSTSNKREVISDNTDQKVKTPKQDAPSEHDPSTYSEVPEDRANQDQRSIDPETLLPERLPVPIFPEPAPTTTADPTSDPTDRDTAASDTHTDDEAAVALKHRCERAHKMMAKGLKPSRRDLKALKQMGRATQTSSGQLR